MDDFNGLFSGATEYFLVNGSDISSDSKSAGNLGFYSDTHDSIDNNYNGYNSASGHTA